MAQSCRDLAQLHAKEDAMLLLDVTLLPALPKSSLAIKHIPMNSLRNSVPILQSLFVP